MVLNTIGKMAKLHTLKGELKKPAGRGYIEILVRPKSHQGILKRMGSDYLVLGKMAYLTSPQETYSIFDTCA